MSGGKTLITLEQFEKDIKQKKLKNFYVFCGSDEGLIKECIEKIKKVTVEGSGFIDLNYARMSGEKLDVDAIINNCETIPFMSDYRVLEVYRASFLRDKNREDKGKEIDTLRDYVKTIPPYTILIMYYVFEDDREKPGNRIKKLEKACEVVKVDKLKGIGFQNKVKELFDARGKAIGKAELSYFCSIVENNMNIVENEVEKLALYTGDRAITKEDIIKMAPYEKESDVFNLVSYLSDRNIKGAIDTLNELVYKGEKPHVILSMIERQFKLLFSIRVKMGKGAKKDDLVKEYRLNPYIAEKMMSQSKRFSEETLRRNLQLCLDTEVEIKSKSVDTKNAVEMLMVRTMMKK